MISIMVCPLKELDTSALSVSPRRLTEGVLEGEGPTSADAGVASCLLFDTEPVFRRLRDDYWDGIVFVVGMIRLGGIELPKGVRGNALGTVELSRRTVILNFAIESGGTLDAIRQFSTAKNFLSNNHQTSRP